MKKLTKEWFIAALIRAIKTMAQVALSMFTVGQALHEVDWMNVLSVALVAGLYSLIMSLAGLPEANTDGTLEIDTSDPDKDYYRFVLDEDVPYLKDKRVVSFKVNPKADLGNVPTDESE